MSQDSGKTVVVKEAIHPYRWAAVSAAFLVIGIGFFLTVQDLRATDAKIQRSRVESCIRIYGAFPEVFDPFFPSAFQQTTKQKHDLEKLNRTVRRLQSHCAEQTRINGH